jgi:hypothetical protein
MSDIVTGGGIYESEKQALEARDKAEANVKLVKLWLDAIDLATKEEAEWRKRAQAAIDIYRDHKERNERRFNILYANTETIIPSLYSSIPVPDIRRRYADNDPAGKVVAQILERAISYSVDAYDFDAVMRAAVSDCELPGRAITRVRYVPYLQPMEAQAEASGEVMEGQPQEQVAYEEVICEHVPWSNFRRGPARMWGDLPWIAFELFLTREQLEALSPELGANIKLDCPVEGYDETKSDGPPPEVFKRARVWEIWDREKKQVLFIAESHKEAPIRVDGDPLELQGFFPIPRALYSTQTSDSLVPIEPYRYYKDQAEELDRITRRISKLILILKWRGFYPGSDQSAGAMTQLKDADDGDMIPVTDFQSFLAAAGGDLSKAFWMMPIEQASAVLTNLYLQREQIKQVIYEITGTADIMRGSTDPNETLGAQQIKAQWGSLRVQRKQAEVQRYARDLFRMKAELFATKFSMETLELMTGIKLPTMQDKQQAQMIAQQAQQAQQPVPDEVMKVLEQPTREEVEQLLRNDALRSFRIDVESDSTIRGDLTRFQENVTNFMNGTAQYLSAVGPMVQANVIPKEMAIRLYVPFTRQFKLGREVEDMLENMVTLAEQDAKQPQPPSPDEIKAQAEQTRSKQETERMQMQMQGEQQKLSMDMQMKQAEHQFKMDEMQASMAIKQQELALKEQELALKEREMLLSLQLKEREAQINAQSMERKHEMSLEAGEHKHAVGMEMIEAKREQAMEPAGA